MDSFINSGSKETMCSVLFDALFFRKESRSLSRSMQHYYLNMQLAR